jgi:hypothetical protein
MGFVGPGGLCELLANVHLRLSSDSSCLVLVEQSALFAAKRTGRRVHITVVLRQWLALCVH